MSNLRPTARDGAVISSAVERFYEAIRDWNTSANTYLQSWQVEEAMRVAGDAYHAASYIERNWSFPVDVWLVNLIHRIYESLPNVVASKTHDWVMATKARFPAKEGNTIRFLRDGQERHGVVHAVLHYEARGLVEDVSNRGKYISVYAEDVVKVISTGDARQPTPNNTPPTGGTPVAARGGAILKQAAA